MEYKFKLITVALLALLTGSAFASPLLIEKLNVKPFPRVSEGPKADFKIDVVFANFSFVEGEFNDTSTLPTANGTYVNVTRTYKYTNVTYTIVANITNLSDLTAMLHEVSFAAAPEIKITYSALGGESFNRGYRDTGVNFGGVVEGVWLDNEWINTTWIPGTDYPFNMFSILTPSHYARQAIPELPENATEIGTWIEGVPIAEYHNSTQMTGTHIYINGAWVDVTGRVQPYNPQPMVMAMNTLVNQKMTLSRQPYKNVGNASVGPVTALPGWKMYNSNGPTIRWQANGFNATFAPHQSTLVAFVNTQMFVVESGEANYGIESLEARNITVYVSATNYINGSPVEGVYYNTVSTATWLNTLPLTKTGNGYVFNVILADDQVFKFQNGFEVIITEDNLP